jgi:hypothetical protein
MSDGGFETRYTKYKGRKIFTIESESGGLDSGGHNQNTELRSWWSDCGYGTKSSIFVYHPQSIDTSLSPIVMPKNNEFIQAVEDGPFARVTSIELAEVAPFVSSETG